MKSYNNEIEVSRNETFVYHRELTNKDGSPYIIPLSIDNPYIRMTIADENYTSETRYLLNIYLDVNTAWDGAPLPRFYMTNPVLWNGEFTIDNIPGGQDNPLPEDLKGDPGDEDPYKYGVSIYNYAVYYNYDEATQTNVYMIYVEDEEDGDYWTTYKYEIMVPFGIDITREWTAKNYTYGIFLMGGHLYIDQMISTVVEYMTEDNEISEDAYDRASNMTEEELYQYILDHSNKGDPKPLNKVAKIDGREVIIDRSNDKWSPYWMVDYDYPMLNPSRITVNNDPIGGII